MALPKASRRSPDSSAASVVEPVDRLMLASADMHSLIVSVFPAPDSPETSSDCGVPPLPSIMEEKAPTTMEWACGGRLRVSGEADEVCLAISSMLDGAHVGTGLYGFITTSTGPMFVKMASRSRRRRKVWSIAPKLTSPRPTMSLQAARAGSVSETMLHAATSASGRSISRSMPGGASPRRSITWPPIEPRITSAMVQASSSGTESQILVPTPGADINGERVGGAPKWR
mmetsp:Transcript_31750/g.102554  ORF Transcript_31750/g.102554 Transcript_31750/m.102554 type:complete len:229 (+) Transcript_31750:1830-2516(+)